jgi:hypothetical protein
MLPKLRTAIVPMTLHSLRCPPTDHAKLFSRHFRARHTGPWKAEPVIPLKRVTRGWRNWQTRWP